MMYLISSIHSPNKVGYLAGQFWVLRILRLVTAKVMYTLFFLEIKKRNKEKRFTYYPARYNKSMTNVNLD
jgi:hypothetical protein